MGLDNVKCVVGYFLLHSFLFNENPLGVLLKELVVNCKVLQLLFMCHPLELFICGRDKRNDL